MTMDYVLIHFSTAKMFPPMKRKHDFLRGYNLLIPVLLVSLEKWSVQFGQDEVVSRLFLNITKITTNASRKLSGWLFKMLEHILAADFLSK